MLSAAEDEDGGGCDPPDSSKTDNENDDVNLSMRSSQSKGALLDMRFSKDQSKVTFKKLLTEEKAETEIPKLIQP